MAINNSMIAVAFGALLLGATFQLVEAGEHFKVFVGKTVTALVSGDTVANHIISNQTSISKTICVSGCSSNALCKAVLYDTTASTCYQLDNYADASQILGLADNTTRSVYSKVPVAATASQIVGTKTGSLDMDNLNTTIYLRNFLCPYETELGVVNNEIPTSGFTAAGTCPNSAQQPWHGRLNAANANSWCGCSTSSTGNWLQVDLGYPKWVTKVSTSAGDPGTYWTTSYKLLYSYDPAGVNWATYKTSGGQDMIFTGNTDRTSVVTNKMWRPFLARWVRFLAVTWYNAPCLRVAIYGCNAQCRSPLGIHSYDVADEQISAESSWCDGTHRPWYGRLNSRRGSWHEGCLHRVDHTLEADFLKNRYATGVAVQGCVHPWTSYWLTQFSVIFQLDGSDEWQYVVDANGNTNFKGGVNNEQAIFYYFDFPIIARKIKIVPRLHSSTFMCIRIEVLGCRDFEAKTYMATLTTPATTITTSSTVFHKAVTGLIDGRTDTCSILSAATPSTPSLTIDLGTTKTISEVQVTPLIETDLNPVAIYIFDMYTRGQDLSGNGNHAYMAQSTTFVPDPVGRPNGAAYISGEDVAIYGAVYNEVYPKTGDHSFFLWINAPAYVYDRNILTFQDPSGNMLWWGIHYWLLTDGSRFIRNAGDAAAYQGYNPIYTLNTWAYIGFTWEASTNRLTFYYNGEVDTEFVASLNFAAYAKSAFYMGRHQASCSDARNGPIKAYCLQMYNRVLSKSEIMSSMRCPWADYPRPVALVNLDDVSYLADQSGNGYNGVANNVAVGQFAQFPNKAYQFSGGTSSVTISAAGLISKLQNYMSFSVFHHVVCTSGAPCTFASLMSGGSYKWKIFMFQNNYHEVNFACGPTSIGGYANLTLGVRYYVGFTYNFVTKLATFYIEGHPIASGSVSCNFGSATGDSLVVGGFIGKVACWQVFDRALTQRHVNMVGTSPLTVASDMKAVAMFSAQANYMCSSNIVNAVKPDTGAVLAQPNGYDWGGSAAFMPWYNYHSVCYNGVSHYAQGTMDSSVVPTGGFTIMMWIHFNSVSSDYTIVHMHSGSAQQLAINFQASNKYIYANCKCSNNNNAGDSPNVGPFVATKWYHIAFIFDPSKKTMTMTMNGGQLINTPVAANCTLASMTTLSIGKVPWSSNYFAGCYNCLRIFKYPLGLEEINDLMNACPLPTQVEPKQCHADLTATLPDSAITASSYAVSAYSWFPALARSLYGNFNGTSSIACCWRPATDSGSWLQFTFPKVKRISAIATAGSSNTGIATYVVTTYFVQYSPRAIASSPMWTYYLDKLTGGAMTFQGSSDPYSVMHNRLTPEIDTMYLRILPQTWVNAAAMRVAIYGCDLPQCGANLLADVPDSRITALNAVAGYTPVLGYIGSTGYWMAVSPGPGANPENEFVWWQAQFSSVKKITKISTQGSGGNGWIATYYFRYSRDGRNWDGHRDKDGFLKLIPGNTDQSTIVEYSVGPYFGTYIRFHPQDYAYNMAGRFGVKGCDVEFDSQPLAPLLIYSSDNASNLYQNSCYRSGEMPLSVETARYRCRAGTTGRYLSLTTAYPSYDIAVCEVSATTDNAVNLVSSRKANLGGSSFSATSIDNAPELTDGVLSATRYDGSVWFDTAGQYAYFDIGFPVRVTRVVAVFSLDFTESQITTLDLKVGNSTDVTAAQYCDTFDPTVVNTGGLATLWCLAPTYGRYVFLYRSQIVWPAMVPITEIMVF